MDRSSVTEQRSKSLNLTHLSISEFTSRDKKSVGSHNIGVVELMVLHACDKCIFSKSKWILSMDMVTAASHHLNIDSNSLASIEEYKVVLETEDGLETCNIKNLSRFDASIVDIERSLLRQVSIFSQLLWRYHLMTELFPDQIQETTIDWKKYSFTQLRMKLVDIFATRQYTLSLKHTLIPSSTSSTAQSSFYSKRNPSLEVLTGLLKSVSPNIIRGDEIQKRTTAARASVPIQKREPPLQSHLSHMPHIALQVTHSDPIPRRDKFTRPFETETSRLNRNLNVSTGGTSGQEKASPSLVTPLTHEALFQRYQK